MRDHMRSNFAPIRREAKRLCWLVFLCAVVCPPVYSRTASSSQTASSQERPMKHYGLFFRTGRTLTPEEVKQRAVDIQLWVKRVTEMGVTLDPRTLGETTRFSTEGGAVISHEGPIDPALTTVVFFDSASS